MTPDERLKEIEFLHEDKFFWDNPNYSDTKERIDWLINRVKRLTELVQEGMAMNGSGKWLKKARKALEEE